MVKKCMQCGKDFEGLKDSRFCCRSCAATYNNLHRVRRAPRTTIRRCAICGTECEASVHTSNNKVRCPNCQSKLSKQKQAALNMGITKCLCCSKDLSQTQTKYCSITCQHRLESKLKFIQLSEGTASGKLLTGAMRRILIELRGHKCECCGWDKINPKTGLRPLQIHHIDGDCLNNNLENLQVLCPNCHSLTDTFGASNSKSTRPKASQAGRYYEER